MWKKRSQRLSRGSCVVINELALLIEGGGDEPDLHEHSWGSEKEVAKSGPWKLDPIKNSVYKTHPRKEEAINLYQDWSIRVIRCFLRLGYDIDIGVTKQDPSARLGQKDPSNGTKKRMYALFQVEGKGAAQMAQPTRGPRDRSPRVHRSPQPGRGLGLRRTRSSRRKGSGARYVSIDL